MTQQTPTGSHARSATDAVVEAVAASRPARRPPGRSIASLRDAWPALAAYVAIRSVGLLVLLAWADARHRSLAEALARADAGHYLEIAERGYDLGLGPGPSNLAFFPLYPALEAGLARITPLDHIQSGLAVAWLAALVAAWGIYAVGAKVGGRTVGVMLAAVWAALPHAIVESMPYTESLFTAFAAWTLFAVLEERWLTTGFLCLLAGLTRPNASALILVVGLAATVAVVRQRDAWRPWIAMVLAPLGWLAYLVWVGGRTGRVDGWYHIQSRQWHSSFDAGVYTVRMTWKVLATASRLELVLVTITLVSALALFVLCLIDRQTWPLLLYSGLMLITAIGTAGYYNAKARLLLPAFPLLLPIAAGLARITTPRRVVIISTLTLVSAYVGGYLLLVWQRSP